MTCAQQPTEEPAAGGRGCFEGGAHFVQVMRHDVSVALGKTGPNVDVMCTDKQFGGRFMPFAQVGLLGEPTQDSACC
jgi:hypothetical protein